MHALLPRAFVSFGASSMLETHEPEDVGRTASYQAGVKKVCIQGQQQNGSRRQSRARDYFLRRASRTMFDHDEIDIPTYVRCCIHICSTTQTLFNRDLYSETKQNGPTTNSTTESHIWKYCHCRQSLIVAVVAAVADDDHCPLLLLAVEPTTLRICSYPALAY